MPDMFCTPETNRNKIFMPEKQKYRKILHAGRVFSKSEYDSINSLIMYLRNLRLQDCYFPQSLLKLERDQNCIGT